MDENRKRTWAEIDLMALDRNYHTLRGMLPTGCRMLCSVKADGYGHGAVPVARRLESLGCDYLAVASLDEGIKLRKAGITLPILILGWTDPCYGATLIRYGLTQSVFDAETALSLSHCAQRAGKSLGVHLAIDTGMSRLGLLCGEKELAGTVEEVERLCALPGLAWEGIFTHFSDADGSEAYTMLQFTRFLDLLKALEEKGIKFKIRHCAASAAVINYPCTCLDMVRPGIALYGHYPDPSCQGLTDEALVPMMTLKTRVASVKTLPAGSAVSYGRTHVLERESRLAVLSVGYGDGLPRACSDKLLVGFEGGVAPVVGRICMDLCMVDVTDLPQVRQGDVAVLWGPARPVEEAAQLAGTIQYELLCGVSGRVPRVYLA